ncbi:MAG TPA: carbonate dehydratase, partial [Synergistaceae bacterium]|nr:carbonate dehydratase [Synergistaceae bacterium]
MTVTRVVLPGSVVEVEGAGYSPEGKLTAEGGGPEPEGDKAFNWFVTAGAVCNEARLFEEEGSWNVDGNPTEGALLTLAKKAGQEPEEAARTWKRIDAIPFESDHKFMATLNESGGERKVFLKGAPEAVLDRCDSQMKQDGGTEEIDRSDWEKRSEDLADEGFRLLAVAMAERSSGSDDLTFDDVEEGFPLLGFAAIMDPPRPEAIEALEKCKNAGIRVKMITG